MLTALQIITQFDGEAEYFFEEFDLDLTYFTFMSVSQGIIRANILDPRDRHFEEAYEIDFSSVNPARILVTILRARLK